MYTAGTRRPAVSKRVQNFKPVKNSDSHCCIIERLIRNYDKIEGKNQFKASLFL
jgi:hypothetical protein